MSEEQIQVFEIHLRTEDILLLTKTHSSGDPGTSWQEAGTQNNDAPALQMCFFMDGLKDVGLLYENLACGYAIKACTKEGQNASDN